MRDRTRHVVMLAGSAGALLAACALVGPPRAPQELVPGRPARFPHDVHMAQDMACTDCHVTAEEEAAAGMPAMELCLSCHDEALDADKPRERTPAGFVREGESEPAWTQVTGFTIETSFSHAAHGRAEVQCAECHPGVAESGAVDISWRVDMDGCMDCHARQRVADGGCIGCHAAIGPDWQPASHDPDWLRAHGLSSLAAGGLSAAPAANCALCHREDECASCHNRMEPADHTEPFRVRGHGFAASLDRSRCNTCHREDSCVRCHRETEPLSHTGGWGSPLNSHCGSCHLPLNSSDGCTVCHTNTASHRQAPRRPGAPHPGPGADCRSCHFPPPHFDNGDNCSFCHR